MVTSYDGREAEAEQCGALANAVIISSAQQTTYIKILVGLHEASPVADSQTTKGCYQCFDLMNKRWRSDMLGECSGTKHDCGKCIEGYHANSGDDNCQPSNVIIVENSGIALIPNGSNAVIKCEFQEEYHCSWIRRGYLLHISGRYKFQGRNGLKTKICTIAIDPVIFPIDYGLWECTSMADSKHEAKSSIAVNLTSDRFITVNENDTDAFVPSGETVGIQCHFNELVDCAWKREKHEVEIKGRYSYLTNDGGISTTDCSIMIINFSKVDTGLWDCQSVAQSSSGAIQSTKVHIKQAIMPSVTIAPQNATAMEGDNVVLRCEFDAEVDCNWQKDGVPVVVDIRYQFTGKTVQNVQTRRNCSLRINPFRKSDVGRWACNYNGNMNSNTTATSAWITIKKKPSYPCINLRNSTGLYGCSNNLAINEGSQLVCTSENGNPASQLRWTLEGLDFAPDNIKTNGTDDVFNVTITLDFSLHKNQFKTGWNALKCIITHPTINGELSTQVDILVMGQTKVRSEKDGEKAICYQDAQSFIKMQRSNCRRIEVSREITAAAIVHVFSIYLLTQ